MTLLAVVATGLAVGGVTAVGLGLVRGPRIRLSSRSGSRSRAEPHGRVWLVSIVVGGIVFLVLWAVTGVVAVALPPAVLVALLPRAYLRRARDRELAEVRQAWPDGIRDLLASISAGVSLSRAIDSLSRSGPRPIRRVFTRYPLLAKTIGVVPALETIRDDLADPASDRVIEVLIVAHERGGAIVPVILADLADAASADGWALEEIRTASLEQRINARVVFVLPWIVLVAMTLRQGAFRDFYASAAGVMVVALGAAMSLLGMALVTRIGREPDEPRVFGGHP